MRRAAVLSCTPLLGEVCFKCLCDRSGASLGNLHTHEHWLRMQRPAYADRKQDGLLRHPDLDVFVSQTIDRCEEL